MAADDKTYNYLEKTLCEINRKVISLPFTEVKRNNEILGKLLDVVISKMRGKNSLFNEMYREQFFAGSYYDGLKVSKPDEYDIDLCMVLPKQLKYKVAAATDIPGFVVVSFQNWKPTLDSLDLKQKYKGLNDLVNANQYLDKSKVLSWIEKVISLAINDVKSIHLERYGTFTLKVVKQGPAFTLRVQGTVENRVILNVDLVPTFVFSSSSWPEGTFRSTPHKCKDFLIVPKPLKNIAQKDQYWRVSFQKQEKAIIDGKGPLKPAVKLLKKMRDFLDHKQISSYYIKTVALWMVDNKDGDFWNNSLSFIFMTMLKQYQDYLQGCNIPYYWNKHLNLLDRLDKATLFNVSNKLSKIINDITTHPEDPYIVGRYLVSSQELLAIRNSHM